MNLNIYNSLILAGIIQGFIFTVVVLSSKKYKAKSTLFLITLIITYSLGNLQYLIPDIGLMSLENMYLYLYLPWASLIPTLIFFYVLSFLNPLKRLDMERLLYIPFLIFFVIVLVFRLDFLFDDDVKSMSSTFKFVVNANEIFSVFFSIILISILIYKVFAFEKKLKALEVTSIYSNLIWMKITLILIYIFTFIWAYITYRNLFVKGASPNFYILWIGIAATIYWLGHIGVYKYGILEERKKIRNFKGIRRDYNNHNNASQNSHIKNFENLLMNEQLYLNHSISLEILAEKLGLSASYLSKIIKSELNMGFTDYLNNLRINEAKSYLSNPEFDDYTVTSIGLEAGFNSKSAFYDVFKKATGKSPLKYKKEIRNLS